MVRYAPLLTNQALKPSADMKFLDKNEKEAINKFKDILMKNYLNDIGNFYLFGSKARGDFHKNSDIDILITLKNYNWKLGDKIRRIGYELDEEIDYKFSIIIISESEFQTLKDNKYQFYMNVLNDGVII